MAISNKTKIKAFKTDLILLLEKHNASLDLIVKGDTFGIHDEGIGVSFKEDLKPGDRYAGWSETTRLVHGYGMNAAFLKQY